MTTPTDIEICYMLDFRKLPEIPANCNRVYFGHETCEKLLPAFEEIGDLLEIAERRMLGLTFVTPFLTEKGMEKVLLFLDQLKTVKPLSMEIVTSDWGLIHWMTLNNIGVPVVSRFMVGQQVDFRLTDGKNRAKEQIVFMDGKYRKLAPKKLSPEMVDHLSSCTLLKDKTAKIFHKLGVTRFELNNVFQPIVLPSNGKFRYSLHVPFVPLTIFRSCPENMDFNHPKKACCIHNCNHNRQKWLSPSSKCDIYCLDNALYYCNPDIEPQLKLNDQIDRIVYHDMV